MLKEGSSHDAVFGQSADECVVPALALESAELPPRAEVGVGAGPIDGAELLFDGTRQMLDEKWTYWKGPRFSSSLPNLMIR